MNIGLISSNPYNVFASTLIERLCQIGNRPSAVFCMKKSKAALLKDYLRTHGLLATIRKVVEVSGVQPKSVSSNVRILTRYARENGLSDCSFSLLAVCQKHDIEYVVIENLNKPETIEKIKGRNIELLLNAAGEIFRKPVIDSIPLGIWNTHIGLLPQFRGYDVLEWSLFCNREIGVTLHYIDPGVDTGDIIRFFPIEAANDDTVDILLAKSFPVQIEAHLWGIELLSKGQTLPRKPQTYEDGRQYFKMHPELLEIAEAQIPGYC